MIFIGGISQGMQQLDYMKTVICGRCGAYGRYEVFMTYMYFSFFFIPLFKWNRKFFVKMSCCGAVYDLDPEKGMAILRGQQAEITEADLTLREEGQGRRYVKKCSSCGYETEEDFEFCPKCGQRF
ncbi:MAG: zinc ribbon domain-containing protein [Clostridium sp.]|nr:zinc ribbon domain-containing protein [Clostridium sp.]